MLLHMEPHRLDVEIEGGAKSIVVAFLRRNERFGEQKAALERACADASPNVVCCLYDLDYFEAAVKKYQVWGTPTFLFFQGGRERQRVIGEMDDEGFVDFIAKGIARQEVE